MDSVAGAPASAAARGASGHAAPSSLTPASSLVLDQWRGLALAIVLAAHAFDWTGHAGGLARIGVNLFFFVSGVLVYRSLTPGPRLPRLAWEWASAFWLRRLRRLFPALAGYALLMIPVVGLMEGGVELLQHYVRALPYVLTFTSNTQDAWMPMPLYHLWSLACEMQFYFVAPLLFLAGGSRGFQRTLIWGALACLALALGVHPAVSGLTHKNEFAFSVWALLLGFVAEALRERLPALSPALLRTAVAAGLGGFAVAVAIIAGQLPGKNLAFVAGTGLLLGCYGCYLGGLAARGGPGRALAWLGKRTYSIYLWQEPLTLCAYLPGPLRPLAVLAALPIGALSYRWLEKPFLSTVHRRPKART